MIWKVLIFAIAAYVLYRLFMNDRRKKEEAVQEKNVSKIADGDLVKDPVCGTYVERESSVSVRDGDHVEYFCSHDCRGKYIEQIEEQTKSSS